MGLITSVKNTQLEGFSNRMVPPFNPMSASDDLKEPHGLLFLVPCACGVGAMPSHVSAPQGLKEAPRTWSNPFGACC